MSDEGTLIAYALCTCLSHGDGTFDIESTTLYM